MLNLSTTITRGESYLAISRASADDRRRIYEHALPKIWGAEILCEDPLIIGFRARNRGEARAAAELLGEDVIVVRGGARLAKNLCSCDDSDRLSARFTVFFDSIASQIRFAEQGFFSKIARVIPLVAPSIVSTVGRFVNDMNMIIAGSIASGGVLIINIYSSRRGFSTKAVEESTGAIKRIDRLLRRKDPRRA